VTHSIGTAEVCPFVVVVLKARLPNLARDMKVSQPGQAVGEFSINTKIRLILDSKYVETK